MSFRKFLNSRWAVPEVIPLIVPIIGGIAGAMYMGQKHLTQNNDVIVNKGKPRQWKEKDQYKNFISREDSVEWLKSKGFYSGNPNSGNRSGNSSSNHD